MKARAILSAGMLVCSLALVAPPAAAAGCGGAGYGYSTRTYSVSYDAGCNTRARIDRYQNGSVKSYLGTWGRTSDVSSSSGYNSGNYWQLGPSDWMRI